MAFLLNVFNDFFCVSIRAQVYFIEDKQSVFRSDFRVQKVCRRVRNLSGFYTCVPNFNEYVAVTNGLEYLPRSLLHVAWKPV